MPPARRAPPPTAPPRQRLGLEERREQLLSAAFELFAGRSYDEVGMEDVARAAGVSKALLYHYFPTKRHLYRDVVQRGADLLLARTATPEDTPPLERLTVGLRAYFTYVDEHAAAYGALMRSGVGVDAEVAGIVEATRETIAARVLEGLHVPGVGTQPPVRAAVRGWIGFVEALALRWLADREPPMDVLQRLAMAVLPSAVGEALGGPAQTRLGVSDDAHAEPRPGR